MLRVAWVALVFANATAEVLAQSSGYCDGVEACESYLQPPALERQKAIIEELNKQRDELNKMRPPAAVKSDGKADPKQNEAAPKKEQAQTPQGCE